MTKKFLKYTIIWIAGNLSIPFWVVGHVHLTMNIYEDIYEILASCGDARELTQPQHFINIQRWEHWREPVAEYLSW